MSNRQHVCTVDNPGMGGRYEVSLVGGGLEILHVDHLGAITSVSSCEFCGHVGNSRGAVVEDALLRLAKSLEMQSCGHPFACVVSSGPPEWRSSHCVACAQQARLVAQAVAAEREACAKVASAPSTLLAAGWMGGRICEEIAKIIRARGGP